MATKKLVAVTGPGVGPDAVTRLNAEQAERQQVLRKQLLTQYAEVFPSSYAPCVGSPVQGYTYRFFVRQHGDPFAASVMVEVHDKPRKVR